MLVSSALNSVFVNVVDLRPEESLVIVLIDRCKVTSRR